MGSITPGKYSPLSTSAGGVGTFGLLAITGMGTGNADTVIHTVTVVIVHALVCLTVDAGFGLRGSRLHVYEGIPSSGTEASAARLIHHPGIGALHLDVFLTASIGLVVKTAGYRTT